MPLRRLNYTVFVGNKRRPALERVRVLVPLW